MLLPRGLTRSLAPLGAGVSVVVVFLAVLSIPLSVAADLGLSDAETTSWIMALYGVSALLSLALVLRFRQPLLVTGNVFVLIFVSRLSDRFSWPELIGAAMFAGVVVLLLGPLGLTDRLARWLPEPIVFGLLAGAVLPFFTRLFTALGDAPLLVGGTLLAYVLGRRFTEPRVPAILPALVVGVALAGLGEGFVMPQGTAFPELALTAPAFSLPAIVTATPVMVALITLQANVPSMVFLRSQSYRPPERVVSAVSGAGTLAGSLLGPIGASLSLPATALCGGPDAGATASRHGSVYVAAGGALVIAVLAGFAADLASVVPQALLTAIVGLAVASVLTTAIQRVAEGPLVLGPTFAFAIALSDLSLLGLGPFFWALAIGMAVSLVLERDPFDRQRTEPPTPS